jgi:hypothetical protein
LSDGIVETRSLNPVIGVVENNVFVV